MKTLNHLIAGSCTKYADRPALGMVFEKPITYAELDKRIRQIAAALIDAGVKKGTKIAILSENSPDWGAVYLAVVRLGGIVIPILPDFHESDVRHILFDSKVHLLFLSGRQLEKIYELKNKKPKEIIVLDDKVKEMAPIDTVLFSDFLSRGKDAESLKEKIAELAGSVKETDLASIIYTSGTSGHSKAVMLSHKNLVSNVGSANGIIDIQAGWTFLSILPMSHTYEFTVGFLLPLSNGVRIVYAGGRPTPTLLQKICAHEKPSVACVVPMILEKIYKKRVLPKLENSMFLKFIMWLPGMKKRIYRKIGNKLINFFGGELELLAIGGAAINYEVEKFFKEAGFPYIIGYGLTETSPILTGGPWLDPTVAVGSAGKPLPKVQIKIVNPEKETGVGEIFAKGPNVMQGYYQNPELTSEVIDEDGWFETGDLGYLDEYDNLFIRGRSKSVIVLSHGENIYPEAIEDKINAFQHVAECLVVANNDKLEALIYLDYDLVDEDTKGKSQKEKAEHINSLLAQMKKTVNERLPAFSQISKFVERQEPFIKTATHKIKRYLYCQSTYTSN